MAQTTYLEAIRQGLWEEMERDPSVFCLGEDIGIYGGAFKVTDGFIHHFGPERVIDTPIAESAIVGAAFGASLTGMRPVAEFQFMDFIGCAFNQVALSLGRACAAGPARPGRRRRPRWSVSLAEPGDALCAHAGDQGGGAGYAE
jgi:pyruvate/2-oxoglutarate/acetoin dehydrogenase E1 component